MLKSLALKGVTIMLWLHVVPTVEKKLNRHNFALDEQISFQFWKLSEKNSNAMELLPKTTCLSFMTEMTSNVRTNPIVWRHFRTRNVKIVPKFFDKRVQCDIRSMFRMLMLYNCKKFHETEFQISRSRSS